MKRPSSNDQSTGNTLLKARIFHTRIFCLLLIPLLVVAAPGWPEHSLPHEIMEFSGHFLVSGGVLIRVLSSVYIGGRKNAALVTEGPFSIVRNPLYVGSFLALTGLALMTASLTLMAIMIAAFCLYYSATVRREEAYLQQKFGATYRSYAERVPRWVPEPLLWEEPRETRTKPYFVRRAALDASVFLLIVPLLQGLCELRESGAVPVLLILP